MSSESGPPSTSASSKRASVIGHRTSTANKRQTVSQLPKPPCFLDPAAIIANHAVLTGVYPITIEPRAVIHPYARIASVDGPVVIGEGCHVWERTVVGTDWQSDAEMKTTQRDGDAQKKVVLGKNVVIEAGATVSAAEVGEGTVIEVNAKVGEGAVIGKYCKIVQLQNIPSQSAIPDYTVVYGMNQRRTDTSLRDNSIIHDFRISGHKKHNAVLQQLVPSNLAKWA